jgi:hypothetical protein
MALKKIKKIIVWVVMFVLGRSFQAASKMDPIIQREIAPWDDDVVVLIQVLPGGPKMCLKKQSGRIKFLILKSEKPDLVINFKSIEAAFPVMTGLLGVEQGFAQNRMTVLGDIPTALSLIRCINRLEAYLFPKILSQRILKKVPNLGIHGQLIRLRLYVTGIIFGF